ncbi:hypothetical protein DPMN_017565 [Dreissena polymorpha]|uniref:Uncharacterized protein n=1 Tax=Dreissena polymorpha TaxID=45954 RepID=A0A9D4NBL6_DREPO|nr:hypothetical protein DPMN_017565 [Dreissena polymorpha]
MITVITGHYFGMDIREMSAVKVIQSRTRHVGWARYMLLESNLLHHAKMVLNVEVACTD